MAAVRCLHAARPGDAAAHAIAAHQVLDPAPTGLLPDDPLTEARMAEVMAHVEGTIHGQGYVRIFAPKLFEPQDVVHGTLGVGQQTVQQQGKEMVEMCFAILDPQLGRHPYAASDKFTVADAALFNVERWAPQRISLPVNVRAHYERLLTRPSVRKVRDLWGES